MLCRSLLPCQVPTSSSRLSAAKAFKLQDASRKSRHIKQNYYLGGACGGLRRFRQRMTCRDLAGQARFSRFDPIRLRLEHDRKDFIGAIGARNALRAPCGDERKPMDVSEDGIRGLRRFGGSSQSLSDLVDAEEVSRHLGITPRRVLSMARKGLDSLREAQREDHSLRYRSCRPGPWKAVGMLTALLRALPRSAAFGRSTRYDF